MVAEENVRYVTHHGLIINQTEECSEKTYQNKFTETHLSFLRKESYKYTQSTFASIHVLAKIWQI